MEHKKLLLGVALTAIVLVAYWPAMRHGGFVWDDDDYVTGNRMLRSAGGLKQVWTRPGAVPQYYPLVHTTYWLEYRLWELNPHGYHVVNVLLHMLGVLLLWHVLEALRVPCAWLGAALFALHPVHVESVAWVTERKNVLSGVFYLAAALAYLRAAGGEKLKGGGYVLSVLLFVCALLSKTVTCTLPAALLLVLTRREGAKNWKRHAMLTLPMFLLGAFFAAVTVWMERNSVGAAGKDWDLSIVERFLIAGRAVWFYAWKLVWPAKLTFIYPRWEIEAGGWWQYLFPIAAAAVVVVLWALRRRIGAGPLVAVLFFGGTLLPALGFVNVYPMRYSFVADHFQYLASIGLLALAVASASRGARTKGRGPGKRVEIAAAAIVLVVSGALTWRQCGIYRGLEELWTDTLRKNPECWLAHNNLGVLYTEHEDWDRAHAHLKAAITLKPDYERSFCNLGSLRERQGDMRGAAEAYRKALEIDPESAQANYNLGAVLDEWGDIRAAEVHYRRALVPGPHLARTHNNLGNIVLAQGRQAAAFRHFREAIRLDPEYSEPHSNLGILLEKHGEIDDAIMLCSRAVELAPDSAEARNNLALMLVRARRLVEARSQYEKALLVMKRPVPILLSNFADLNVMEGNLIDAEAQYLRALQLNPGLQGARLGLARILVLKTGVNEETLKMRRSILALEQEVAAKPANTEAQKQLGLLLALSGRLPEALHTLRVAARFAPRDAEIHNNQGAVFGRSGSFDLAIAAFEKALELRPDYAEARKNLEHVKKQKSAGLR